MPLALLLTNALIALCYYAIASLVGVQLFRARGRGLNPLGMATAARSASLPFRSSIGLPFRVNLSLIKRCPCRQPGGDLRALRVRHAGAIR